MVWWNSRIRRQRLGQPIHSRTDSAGPGGLGTSYVDGVPIGRRSRPAAFDYGEAPAIRRRGPSATELLDKVNSSRK